MKQFVTDAIVLTRTDYGEADRILTLLTPEQGKLHVLAKGVRRIKSKLAGGIELFSISTITYGQGRGSLATLVSTRLVKHYGAIVQHLDRTMLGYECIKQLHKITEDQAEPEYFDLLHRTFEALNDATIPLSVVRLWFVAQLLRLGGHTPNLHTDASEQPLTVVGQYDFSYDDMAFIVRPAGAGHFTADHIKLLRLVFDGHAPKTIAQIRGGETLADALLPMIENALRHHVTG